MHGDMITCWLCEATRPRDAALVRYRDEHGSVHPWPDRLGRWQPEYICPECALVYPDWIECDWSGAPSQVSPISGEG
jgi:hypothetical protein